MDNSSPFDSLDSLSPTELKLAGFALAGAGLIAALLALGRWQRHRQQREVRALAVTSCAFDYLRDVLVPDGQGSALHVDFLLLTARGLIVVDLRDLAGNIFGGNQMNAWTVMNRAQRATFLNPQTGLYDRIAAVRLLAQELPVEGRIVFTGRGRFPKGLPQHTLMLDSLSTEFPTSDRESMRGLLERWMPTWNKVKQSVAPSKPSWPKAAI